MISLGGGITGDIVGFAASQFKRGLKFINIPTTLLAQVDSSIGGKTGVNNKYGKNLIGSFKQPDMVISDINIPKLIQTSIGVPHIEPDTSQMGNNGLGSDKLLLIQFSLLT